MSIILFCSIASNSYLYWITPLGLQVINKRDFGVVGLLVILVLMRIKRTVARRVIRGFIIVCWCSNRVDLVTPSYISIRTWVWHVYSSRLLKTGLEFGLNGGSYWDLLLECSVCGLNVYIFDILYSWLDVVLYKGRTLPVGLVIFYRWLWGGRSHIWQCEVRTGVAIRVKVLTLWNLSSFVGFLNFNLHM